MGTLFFAAVLGACLGSFANVLIVRLHEASSIWGRSRCPSCQKTIRPRHLVPVISWILLRGRCADCKKEIHIQYPLVEILGAVFAVVAALRHDPFGPGLGFFFFYGEIFLSIALLVMVGMDARWKELPLEFMVAVGAIAIVGRFFMQPFSWASTLFFIQNTAIAIALPVSFFGLQWMMSKGKWLGSGDVWFGAMIGAVLGTWQGTVIAMYAAYIVGGVAVSILFLSKQVKRGMRVPFAPALASGLLIAMWFGPVFEAYVHSAFSI